MIGLEPLTSNVDPCRLGSFPMPGNRHREEEEVREDHDIHETRGRAESLFPHLPAFHKSLGPYTCQELRLRMVLMLPGMITSRQAIACGREMKRRTRGTAKQILKRQAQATNHKQLTYTR